jgi:hypothetical protein
LFTILNGGVEGYGHGGMNLRCVNGVYVRNGERFFNPWGI